jgi:hypothetical protein
VLWWALGTADDYLAAGSSSRRFATRRTTVDLDYARAVPLRPGTIAEQFDPYGFVAHAFGSVDGHTYTDRMLRVSTTRISSSSWEEILLARSTLAAVTPPT